MNLTDRDWIVPGTYTEGWERTATEVNDIILAGATGSLFYKPRQPYQFA